MLIKKKNINFTMFYMFSNEIVTTFSHISNRNKKKTFENIIKFMFWVYFCLILFMIPRAGLFRAQVVQKS